MLISLILPVLARPLCSGAQRDLASSAAPIDSPLLGGDSGKQELWICDNNSKRRHRFLLQSQDSSIAHLRRFSVRGGDRCYVLLGPLSGCFSSGTNSQQLCELKEAPTGAEV